MASSGSVIALAPAAVRRLQSVLLGRVVTPSDDDYDAARRVWNGMIDRRPVLVVQAASAGDVAPTIAFARSLGLPLAVRGGGHGVAGMGTVEGGVVLDLGLLNRVAAPRGTREICVQGGATLGAMDVATQRLGLVVPAGVVSGTGIGGLTLGGGVGWLTRRYGLTVDNLVSAEVVLATGEQVTASREMHPDLFWGLRGGGGNFGVVTAFTFTGHPLGPTVLAGSLILRHEQWADALFAYARWTERAPDEITTLITFMVPPPDWDLGDRPLMFLGLAWAGTDLADGERAVDELRSVLPSHTSTVGPTNWRAVQSAFDSVLPRGVRAYWRNVWFDDIASAIETLVDHCAAQTWVGTAADLHQMGGAFGRVAEDSTAFPGRSAAFWLNVYGFWSDPADDVPRTAWVKGLSDAMKPHAVGGQYVNFLGRDDSKEKRRVLPIYGAAKLERLREVKRAYDPDNVFQINHNIAP